MKGAVKKIYATICALLMLIGYVLVFCLSLRESNVAATLAVVGMATGMLLAPVVHECGHVAFALCNGMQWMRVKCFCFCFSKAEGEKRVTFASPFAADSTDVLPKHGGNMRKRTVRYVTGGLVCGGVFAATLLVGAILCSAVGKTNWFLWGTLPYSVYLFLLNIVSAEYESGKTDMLVYREIRRNEPTARVLLSVMEIQGLLFEGKRFSEIDEALFYDLPQICEDEPLYAVLTDLRYRYHLDKAETEKAAACLNRLAALQVYLTDRETERIAAELTYMHAVGGDRERADACGALCKDFLQSDCAAAKRVLAAYSAAFGDKTAIAPLMEQARKCLKKEPIAGARMLEESLLARIKY